MTGEPVDTDAIRERDKAREELARLYATRTPTPETLGDVARREFNDRWGWLLDLAGFGR